MTLGVLLIRICCLLLTGSLELCLSRCTSFSLPTVHFVVMFLVSIRVLMLLLLLILLLMLMLSRMVGGNDSRLRAFNKLGHIVVYDFTLIYDRLLRRGSV